MNSLEIDKLDGDALDAAVALALEPYPGADYAGRWWQYDMRVDSSTKGKWLPRHSLDGNVAVLLVEQLLKWGCIATIDLRGPRATNGRYRAECSSADSALYGIAFSDSFAVAVSRMFLQVAEQRKAVAK